MLILKSVFNTDIDLRGDSGFTLLEVMISISIIALIITALFRMQSGSIALVSANKLNRLVPALAGSLMAKINQDLEEWNETRGDFGKDYPGFTWKCEILDADFGDMEFISPENMNKFKKINLTIINQSGDSQFSLTFWRLVND